MEYRNTAGNKQLLLLLKVLAGFSGSKKFLLKSMEVICYFISIDKND
jgi:hypothetical protein